MIKSMMLTSEVIARRLPLLAGEAGMLPGAVLSPGRKESERMVSEKVVAVSEGFVEATFEAVRLQMLGGMMLMRGDVAGFSRLSNSAPDKLVKAFSAPGRKTLAANAKRLRPKK
jgi:hypothetical protein